MIKVIEKQILECKKEIQEVINSETELSEKVEKLVEIKGVGILTIATVIAEVNTIKENDSLLIDTSKVNETIARSSSDIRIYLNRKRKVSNINLVFEGINKAARV